MSSNLAEKRPAMGWIGRTVPRPAEEEGHGHLEVVATRSQRRSRPRAAYALIAVGVLLAIVVGQLLLSIALSQGAYQLSSLQGQQTRLERSVQAASEDLTRVSSPQNLAANANALGMVTDSDPVYLRLSDGAVLGAPRPASGSAGTVTGGQGNLVPNALLAGVPLAVKPTPAAPAAGTVASHGAAASTGATQPGNSASTGAAAAAAPKPTVPLDGALPTPVTH